MQWLKTNIQGLIKVLPQTKFYVLAHMRKPFCLQCAQGAFEVLFQTPITNPNIYNKIVDYESHIFNFGVQRQILLKAKRHLLSYLIMSSKDQVPDSQIQNIINFVQLAEYIVAFAELHSSSIKEFNQTLMLDMNEERKKELKEVKEHIDKINKIQKENKKQILKLELDEVKKIERMDEQQQLGITRINEKQQENIEIKIPELFSSDEKVKSPIQQEIIQQVQVQDQEQYEEQEQLIQINNTHIIQEFRIEDQSEQQNSEQPQQMKQSIYQDRLSVPMPQIFEVSERETQRNTIRDESSNPPTKQEQKNDIEQLDQRLQQKIQNLIEESNTDNLEKLGEIRQKVKTEVSNRRVSAKMALLQNIVSTSLFCKSVGQRKKEEQSSEYLEQVLSRPVRKVRSQSIQAFQ
ncbi:hypothetical protein pb186bvf_003433 [Paramecium bursaria]